MPCNHVYQATEHEGTCHNNCCNPHILGESDLTGQYNEPLRLPAMFSPVSEVDNSGLHERRLGGSLLDYVLLGEKAKPDPLQRRVIIGRHVIVLEIADHFALKGMSGIFIG